MRKRVKGLVTIFLSLLLLLMNVLGNSVQVNAQGNDVIITEPETIILVPGETKTIRVPIKAVGDNISRPVILAEADDVSIKMSQPRLTREGFDTPPNIITPYSTQYIEVDVTVAETAKIGIYPIYLLVTGMAYTFEGEKSINTKLTVNTQILEEKAPAQLTVNKVAVDNQTIGKDINLSFAVKNEGEITARNVFVSIDYAETGMIAGYTTKNVKIDDIVTQDDVTVKLPIKTLSTATPGIRTLTINIDYKIEDGTSFKESHEVYINLRENDNAPNLILDDFSYNMVAKQGESLGLVLRINNSGNSKAVNPRIYVDESSIGSAKFIKDYYTEYIELSNIKADQTIKAEIPMIISKRNTGGEQNLMLNLVYFDEEGVEYKSSVTIYPHIEAEGISEDGKPIVLISNVLQ
ncbi:MAG: hypothetical protein PHC56_01215, partial [Herbinix sp.]|nr:hypothetical protein [Herbinix sp.]